jgi:hypothetical protein
MTISITERDQGLVAIRSLRGLRSSVHVEIHRLVSAQESDAHPPTAISMCYIKTHFPIPFPTLTQCVDGPLGNTIMHNIGVETDELNPPHKVCSFVLFPPDCAPGCVM